MSDEEFDLFITNKREESEIIYNDLMSRDADLRSLYIQRMNFESDFISVSGNRIYFNERKSQLFRYKHNLKKSYKDGLTVRQSYSNSEKFKNSGQIYSKFDDIVLTKIVDVKLEDLYNMFLEAEDREAYEMEYPEFIEYEEYLTVQEMNTARWNKKKINNLLMNKKLLIIAHRRVANKITNEFISSADTKKLYSDVFKELKIALTAKGTLIEENNHIEAIPTTKRINGKPTKGYDINIMEFNL